MTDKRKMFQKRRSGNCDSDLRFLKLSCWMIFLLGFESGGFQLALLKIAREFNITNTEMGGLVSVQFLAMMTMPVIFGALADIVGKKKILLWFSQIFTVGCIVTIVAPSYIGIVLGIFCIGSGYSVCESVLTASLFDEYPQKGTSYAGWTQCCFSIGAVTGPLICDFMMKCGIGDWRNVFYLMASCYAVNGVLLFKLPMKQQQLRIRKKWGIRTLKGLTCRPMMDNVLKYVPNSVIPCFVLMICYVGIETGIAYFLDSFLNLELNASSSSSKILASFWLFMIPGRIFCGKIAKKANKALVICFVSILILLFGWQNCRSIIMFAVLIGCCGVSCGMVWPMLMGMANSRAQGLYGRVSGLMTMGSGIGGAFWPIVFGKLMDVGGIRNSLWMLIATGGVAILILIVQRRQV